MSMGKKDVLKRELVRTLYGIGFSSVDVAGFLRCSPQNVLRILHSEDVEIRGRNLYSRIGFSKETLVALGNELGIHLASNKTGVSETTFYKAYRTLGVKPPGHRLKPIGCEQCKTRPYAKGLCRNCHARQWQRHKKASLQVAKGDK